MVYREGDRWAGFLLADPAPALKVMIVGVSMRRWRSGVCAGLSVFHMRSAGDTTSATRCAFMRETAPSDFGSAGTVEAVYVV